MSHKWYVYEIATGRLQSVNTESHAEELPPEYSEKEIEDQPHFTAWNPETLAVDENDWNKVFTDAEIKARYDAEVKQVFDNYSSDEQAAILRASA